MAALMESSSLRKIKVNLSDYDFQKDIENRLHMANFSISDTEVLEEILYSPLRVSIERLALNLDAMPQDLLPVLEKLSKTGLFVLQGDLVVINKGMRKYYEFQILKFNDDFKPDMEFLQGLLKKVPIHLLPTWYSLPRTSNNIFESIIEKYLQTPNVYQKHIEEIKALNPIYAGMIEDVYGSPDFKVHPRELRKKYNLSCEEFEKHMLFLEFSFALFLSYDPVEDQWDEVVTPLYEWKKYLQFLRQTTFAPIAHPDRIENKKEAEFSFIKDLATILEIFRKSPMDLGNIQRWAEILGKTDNQNYVLRLLEKIKLLQFIEDSKVLSQMGEEWLFMDFENKSIFIYRHPSNRILAGIPEEFCTEKNIREVEKTLKPICLAGWVYFDDYLKGAVIPFNSRSRIYLERKGKTWHYRLPEYSKMEKKWIHETIFEWFFELGMVATGTHRKCNCFKITSFGKTFLEA